MQSRLEMQEPVSGQRLQIHIGLQFGPVLEEGQDVFGDCVNVAARMVKMAKPSQIIAGGECVEALSKPMKDQTRAIDKLPVKGREQEVDVYEVLWRQGEELTYMASRAPGPPKQPLARLSLRHGGKEKILRSEEHTSELQSRLQLVCRLLLEKKKKEAESSWCYEEAWATALPDVA